MTDQNQSVDTLNEVRDIRRMMERGSRFTSVSGLSFIAAGLAACLGAWMAWARISSYYGAADTWQYDGPAFSSLQTDLLLIAAVLFAVAGISALFFTWRKAKRQGVSLMGRTSRMAFYAMVLPLITGGGFILGLLWHDDWRFVAPACLVFYGLALLNASKYTLADIRILAIAEIILGLANMFYTGYGFYFWVAGFGIVHLLAGIVMWWKYERGDNVQ